MKHFILSFILSVNTLIGFAQTCDIPLTPIVTATSDGSYYAQVESYLTNRLRYLVTQSSELSGLDNAQFAIAASYDILDKQIIAGSPTKIVYHINMSLFIVDLKGQKIFSTYAKEMKGIGSNETKALINTFQKLNVGNAEIQTFVQKGKDKIVAYYNNNYHQIVASAKSLAAMKNYDAAIYQLMSVPECCTGYAMVHEALKDIYQQFVNQHCNENLAQARAAWVASPNSDGASTAGIFLSEIYPDAACYQDALNLFNEIKRRMGDIWKFEMKRWDDTMKLEQQRINAMRDISIAYAKSQPKEINVFWE